MCRETKRPNGERNQIHRIDHLGAPAAVRDRLQINVRNQQHKAPQKLRVRARRAGICIRRQSHRPASDLTVVSHKARARLRPSAWNQPSPATGSPRSASSAATMMVTSHSPATCHALRAGSRTGARFRRTKAKVKQRPTPAATRPSRRAGSAVWQRKLPAPRHNCEHDVRREERPCKALRPLQGRRAPRARERDRSDADQASATCATASCASTPRLRLGEQGNHHANTRVSSIPRACHPTRRVSGTQQSSAALTAVAETASRSSKPQHLCAIVREPGLGCEPPRERSISLPRPTPASARLQPSHAVRTQSARRQVRTTRRHTKEGERLQTSRRPRPTPPRAASQRPFNERLLQRGSRRLPPGQATATKRTGSAKTARLTVSPDHSARC